MEGTPVPDVVTIGETMLRLSAPVGIPLEDASELVVHAGGAESNVAIALSRLHTSAGWISRLTDNPLGRRIYNEVRAQGVDVSRVLWTGGDRVGAYFVEVGRSPRPSRVVYDRAGSAMAAIDPDEIDWAYVRAAKVVHLTGITPSLSTSCRDVVVRAIREAKAAKTAVSFDVNYRTRLWTPPAAAAALAPLLSQAAILICTAEDAYTLFGVEGSARIVAEALRNRFSSEVVAVTDGAHFAAASGGRTFEHGGYNVDVVDRIGAGDAFAAGFLHGYLAHDVERGLNFGAALAALKHTYHGDTAWVTAEDVTGLITGNKTWR
jgi:2-dehydro-3-deoxygluconokinase